MKKIFLSSLLVSSLFSFEMPSDRDILYNNEITWKKKYNSFPNKVKGMISLDKYLKERTKEEKLDFLLLTSKDKLSIFKNYLDLNKIVEQYITDNEYNTVISLTHNIPFKNKIHYTSNKKFLKTHNRKKINELFSLLKNDELVFGERLLSFHLIGNLFSNFELNDNDVKIIKELLPNTNDKINTEETIHYLKMFSYIKQGYKFLPFLKNLLETSDNKYIKIFTLNAIIDIYLQNKNTSFNHIEYRVDLENKLNNIDINDYKEYFLLKSYINIEIITLKNKVNELESLYKL